MRLHHVVLVAVAILCHLLNAASAQTVCSLLYKGGNYSGDKFPMLDGAYFTNLEEEHFTVDTVWNDTASFYLEPGCVLRTCNDTNFMGECKSHRHSQIQPGEHFLSASCECSKVHTNLIYI